MITAYSEATHTTYPSFEDLVKAEGNGWVVVSILGDGSEHWPWVVGPFDTKAEANRVRARTRARWNREVANGEAPNFTRRFFVRPAWKG